MEFWETTWAEHMSSILPLRVDSFFFFFFPSSSFVFGVRPTRNVNTTNFLIGLFAWGASGGMREGKTKEGRAGQGRLYMQEFKGHGRSPLAVMPRVVCVWSWTT